MNRSIFEELFVLEMANNHLGKLDRGMRIISEFGRIVRFNGIYAAIKLQIRDVDTFIHKDFVNRTDLRYIHKTIATKLNKDDFKAMIHLIRRNGCIAMATPFDEASVDTCVDLGIEIVKIASSDLNDWPLIEKIAATKLPVIVSTGGSSTKDLDDLVLFFEKRNIPLAVNHCVSIYPSEDNELEIDQIDFLRNRYPNNVIGFSTHEQHDWSSSIMIAYAKGARTFERHIDINDDGVQVSKYCSLPDQIDKWFKAFLKAKEMCGGSAMNRRIIPEKERIYLEALVRGVYARKELPAGHVLDHNTINEDIYLAIPLQKGQLSCRELMSGEKLLGDIKKDEAIMIDKIDSAYARNDDLKRYIYERGV